MNPYVGSSSASGPVQDVHGPRLPGGGVVVEQPAARRAARVAMAVTTWIRCTAWKGRARLYGCRNRNTIPSGRHVGVFYAWSADRRGPRPRALAPLALGLAAPSLRACCATRGSPLRRTNGSCHRPALLS